MRLTNSLLAVIIFLAFSQTALSDAPQRAGKNCVGSIAKVSAPAPEDSALLQATPARELRMARPSRKLLSALNSSLDPEIIMQSLLDGNLRMELFILESDGRLYESSDLFSDKERKVIRDYNDRVTNLEDIMGDYTDSVNYLKEATELKAPPKLIEWLKQYNAKLHDKFLATLDKDGWLPTNPRYLASYAKVTKIISKVKARTDDNFLLDAVASYLEKDAKTVFDINDLDKGIHPLRRHLRWFMLKAQSLNGLIQIRENDGGKVWTHPKLEPDRVAKYSQITVIGEQKRVVWIDRSLFQTIANMVDVLGLAKDTGQFEDIYTQGLLESGAASGKKEARAMAQDLVGRRPDEVTVDPSATADDAQKFLQKYKIREKIAKELRRALP